MEPVSAIIIDDEPGNIVTLTELIKQYCPQVTVLATAQTPAKAIELIKELKPRLIFLDIELSHGNAFDLLDKLLPISFEVIFVTAFNEYAIKAFRYSAIDYLLKPVNITELKDAVKKVITRLDNNSIDTKINSLLENLKTEFNPSGKIALPTSDGSYFENISNIMYLQAAGNYSFIFCKGKGKIIVTKKLKEFEDILPPSTFFRVHNSSLININYVKKYFKGRGGYVQMEDDTTIQISARKKNEFLTFFK
jgi:two-component system, LytTR family, response regulator